MKFIITNLCDYTQEKIIVNKKKNAIKLKYDSGYASHCKGETAVVLSQEGDNLSITFKDKPVISLDFSEADFMRKILNLWNEHLNSPWLPLEERMESIYKLKKGKK